MKVLLAVTYIEGGAGGSAYQLHLGLQKLGVDSQILVKTKTSDDETVIVVPKTRLGKALTPLRSDRYIEKLPLRLYPKRDRSRSFYPQWFPTYSIPETIVQLKPDIINLRWICSSFLQIENISRFNQPIVWTLSDMWPFTGGCDYSQDCDRYTDSCGACPLLGSSKKRDLSHWIWQRKAKAWKNLNLTIVSPSSWLAKVASSSSLFRDLRIEVIPHSVDTEKYKPVNQQIARKTLNLPQDKQLVLFGAWHNYPRKGFHLLQLALHSLKEAGWKDKIELVIFGFAQPENSFVIDFKSHYLGKINDRSLLATVYSSADVMVVPSMQEAFGNTTCESLACGTPVVAFDETGAKDIITHEVSGYLARAFEIEDLARGIAWVLENSNYRMQLSHRARAEAEQKFTVVQEATRYQSLFSEILESKNRSTPNPKSFLLATSR
jgi:glycosyltransferase involved in cell wall biosynthesis